MNATCKSGNPFPDLETEWLNEDGSVVSNGSVMSLVAIPSLSGSYRCQFQDITTKKFVDFLLTVYCECEPRIVKKKLIASTKI